MDGSTDAAGDDPLEDIIQILQHELLSESSKSRKSFAAGAKERPCDAGEEREADSTADYDRLVDRLRESHLTQHHAADDYVLRWLLGHMTGASEDSELNRRRPASWSVLQAIIEGTPLKALVKWLADLNFVPILQETLKEVSSSIIRAPAAATPEVFWPPSNPRKRKRGVAESASLEYLRTPAGCLETGSAIFEVLQTLLLPVSRDVPSDDVHHRMDVEGLKVLFLLPAERMLDLLNPMLDIFLLSFTTPSAQPPTRWFSVFNLLWDMRLQGKTDAFEAATHLTKGTCMLLDRISKHTDKNWDPLLRQFLRRTIISPAKWEFINGEGLDIFRRAAAVTTNIAATSAPILFGLAMAVADGPDKKRQYDGWVHSVFDELEKHVATLDMPQRNQVLKQMVDLSTDWSKAPSLDSLRSVCKNYAIGSDESGVDLSLLSAVAECDADTFIVSAAGIDLLSRLLEITTNVCEVSDTSGALLDVQSIAERLLRGFARARDLPGFIERWFAVSHTCHSKGPCGNMSSHATVWSGERLRLMFSEMLERSMTPRQLVSVLDWLGGQSKNHAEAGLCILRAISDGVVSQPFADAVRMRLRDLAKGFMDGSDSVISTSGRIHYWAIVRRSIREADVTELDSLYKEIHHDLEELAGSCDPIAESVFYCACQLWACSYPDGALEATLCYTVCSYLDEVGQFAERIMSPESGPRWLIGHILQTVEWPLQEIPGFLSMLASRYAKFDAFVKRVLAFCEWMQGSGWEMTNNNQSVQPPMGDDFDIHQMRTLAERIVSRFLQDAGLNNPKVTMLLVDNATRALLKEPILESWGLPDITGISLLDLPNATLGREDREMLMGSWCAATYSDEDEKGATLPGIKWKRTLTIMVALMKKPALHKNMKYRDLALMSKAIKLLHTSGTDDDRRHLPDIIQLFRELCTLTFRHMPKNGQVASTFFNRSPAITDMVAEDAFHEYPHMVILGALSETHGDEGESSILGVMIKNCLERFVREWPSLEAQGNLGDDDWRLLPILTAVDSSRYVAQHLRDQSLSPAVISQLIAASKSLMTAGLDLGWKLWKMLRQIYVEAGEFPLDLGFFARPRSRAVGLLKDCLDVELEGKGEADKLLYIRGIRDAVTDRLDVVGGIFATRHILESLSSEAEASDFSIPECHMWLCERLPDTSSSEELALLTDTIYHLLDQKAKAMTQWNIDRTISSIRVACSARAGHTTHTVLLTSPRGFEYLCRLVELLLKRHRRRIEGRFNVLSDCLTALLRHVMLHPPQVHLPPTPPADDGASKQGHQQDAAVVNDQVWLRQASALARVVQLTCEPTTASVTRYTAIGRPDTGDGDDETGQHQPPPQLLNSAVARAKHLAGQHMHVVLMTYIRVLLTGSGGPLMLPTAIRDCVEQQALWPVWGVLSTDAMKRLEDGLDHGGRTVMKELYRQWTRFGKWTGV